MVILWAAGILCGQTHVTFPGPGTQSRWPLGSAPASRPPPRPPGSCGLSTVFLASSRGTV